MKQQIQRSFVINIKPKTPKDNSEKYDRNVLYQRGIKVQSY